MLVSERIANVLLHIFNVFPLLSHLINLLLILSYMFLGQLNEMDNVTLCKPLHHICNKHFDTINLCLMGFFSKFFSLYTYF